jgi:hypothetical protein
MATYVTEYDVWEALDLENPSISALQIAAASAAVDRALHTAVYAVDTNGLPTDPAVLAAVKLATIVQVQALLAADTARAAAVANPLGRPLSSASIGSASYSASSGSSGDATLSADAHTLPPDGSLCAAALLHLQRIPRTVWTLG